MLCCRPGDEIDVFSPLTIDPICLVNFRSSSKQCPITPIADPVVCEEGGRVKFNVIY